LDGNCTPASGSSGSLHPRWISRQEDVPSPSIQMTCHPPRPGRMRRYVLFALYSRYHTFWGDSVRAVISTIDSCLAAAQEKDNRMHPLLGLDARSLVYNQILSTTLSKTNHL
jgi:hypothetical protein